MNATTETPLYGAAVLKEILGEKVKRNARYSLRAMARDLKVSPSFLSALLSGKKKLPLKRALDYCQALKLDEATAQQLLKAVTIDSAKDPTARHYLMSSLGGGTDRKASEFFILEMDRFKVLSEWYHIAILDLTLVKGFVSDAKWVAEQLQISVMETKAAVERLERLGLLEIRDGRWHKAHKKITIPTTRSERAIREFHAQMMDRAKCALELDNPNEFDLREINGSTLAIDPVRIPEAKEMIRKFRRNLFEFLTEGDSHELYQFNIQLFRLTKSRLSVSSKSPENRKEIRK